MQPKRVTVTSRRTGATRRRHRRGVTELRQHTPIGEAMLASLVHAQLRLSRRVLAVFVAVLGALPLTFALMPSLGDVRIGPVPLLWLLLCVLVFPGLVGLALLYVRQSEQIERDFTELVEQLR